MIVFASIVPHPPILLPSVGSEKDRAQVKNTIKNLEILGEKLIKAEPDSIIISSPHHDWGFEVPLHFLAKDFQGKLEKILIGLEAPQSYFEQGKKLFQGLEKVKKYALIASGDLSHCLKEDGPYGFNPDGPKFDKALIEALKKKDMETILKLDEMYPEAGECGLRSFCFLLGILEEFRSASSRQGRGSPGAAGQANYQTEILSYEGSFGVGYLVANFELN